MADDHDEADFDAYFSDHSDTFLDEHDDEAPNDNNDDDEQHTQKVNGKIERLQIRVKELESELASEKKAHSSLQAKQEKAAASGVFCSVDLINELLKICKKSSVETSMVKSDLSSMTEDNLLFVFRSMGKKIKESVNEAKAATAATERADTEVADGDLLGRIRSLEEELRMALLAAEDIKALKAKLFQMIERNRQEKEGRIKLNVDLKSTRKKIEMLSDHIEKLMTHLKHEAASKVRTIEHLKQKERSFQLMQHKCTLLTRKNSAKDRYITELREGSKILEDQLRLMDEKYLELRSKLDYARESGTRRIKKAEKTCSELRLKFVLSGNAGSLDQIPLPDIYAMASGQHMGGGDSYTDGSGSLMQSSFQSRGASGGSMRASSDGNNMNNRRGGGKSSSKAGRRGTGGSVGFSDGASDFTGEFSRSKPATPIDPDQEVERIVGKIRTKQKSTERWDDQKIKSLITTK